MNNNINFLELISTFNISHLSNYYLLYLEELYLDLSSQSLEVKQGISKEIFFSYYDIPYKINEHLFNIFDKDKDDYLNLNEFLNIMINLFLSQNYYNLTKLIFELYDYDKDGTINYYDIKLLIEYIPLNKNEIDYKKENKNNVNININYEDRKESQSDIFDLLKCSFENDVNKNINFKQFQEIVQNKCSEIFTLILIFLLKSRPFNEEIILLYKNMNKTPKNIDKINNLKIIDHLIKVPIEKKKKFTSSVLMDCKIYKVKKKNNKELKFNINKNEKTNIDKANEIKYFFNKKKTYLKINNSKIQTKNTEDIYDISMDEIHDYYEGYIFKISNKDKLKIYYIKLRQKDFFYYKNRTDTVHLGMHHLTNKVFIQKNEKKIFKEISLYNFCLIYPKKIINFYFKDFEDFKYWFHHFSKAINYKDINNYYTIGEMKYKSKFYIIKECYEIKEINKNIMNNNEETKDNIDYKNNAFMLKEINKKNLTYMEKKLLKNEINILNLCQHPYILPIKSIFNSLDFTQIIYDINPNNVIDLFTYCQNNSTSFEEKDVCLLIHKMLTAIFYLQTYGIVHRDLKPENILIISNNEEDNSNMIPYLFNFEFSKICSYKEKCHEPYGTVSYVAPEVLIEKPYDFKVDLWSIGIITFFLLGGILPFDDDHSEKEIARQTIHDNVKFKSPIWKIRSKESKNFIEGLLKKNPEDRMNIKDALIHNWIRKYFKEDVEKRIEVMLSGVDDFEAFSRILSKKNKI